VLRVYSGTLETGCVVSVLNSTKQRSRKRSGRCSRWPRERFFCFFFFAKELSEISAGDICAVECAIHPAIRCAIPRIRSCGAIYRVTRFRSPDRIEPKTNSRPGQIGESLRSRAEKETVVPINSIARPRKKTLIPKGELHLEIHRRFDCCASQS